MPRFGRRAPRRRQQVSDLTQDQRYHLETGMFYQGGFGADLERFTAAWEEHGEQILAEFIDRHPGRRPFAWWLLEHKQERPMIDRSVPAHRVEALRRADGRGNPFGFLHTRCYGGPAFGPLQEPEEDYLRRKGLLTSEERAALVSAN
jgi:hypothetical protein